MTQALHLHLFLQERQLRIGSQVRIQRRDGNTLVGQITAPLPGDPLDLLPLSHQEGQLGLALSEIAKIEELGFAPQAPTPQPLQSFGVESEPERPQKGALCLLDINGQCSPQPMLQEEDPSGVCVHRAFVFDMDAPLVSGQALTMELAGQIRSGAKGIVVVAPEQLLPHLAALCAWQLSPLTLPLVWCSLHPLLEEGKRTHLKAALCAASQEIAESQICLAPAPFSEKQVYKLVRATHMMSGQRPQDTRGLLATVSEEHYQWHQLGARVREWRQPQQKLVTGGFVEGVCLVRFGPGQQLQHLPTPDDSLKGLIFTGPEAYVPSGFFQYLTQCQQRHIPMYWVHREGTQARLWHREWGRSLLQIGVVDLGEMHPEVSCLKLGWVRSFAQSWSECDHWMQRNIAGEHPNQPITRSAASSRSSGMLM